MTQRDEDRTRDEQPDRPSVAEGDAAADRAARRAERQPGGISAKDIEALETDGKGTGGVGEDLGGHQPLPEPGRD